MCVCVRVCVFVCVCARVLQLEAKESKLSSSMNSIKTFWSPELKKERALRKDEATKMSVWKEQYGVVQDETQVGTCLSVGLSVDLSVCLSVCLSTCLSGASV